MMNSVKYPFNRLYIIGTLCLLCPFLFSSVRLISESIHAGETVLWTLYIGIDLALLFTMAYFIFKGIIPAIKQHAALELDDEKLQYFMYNKTMYWKNVISISNSNNAIVITAEDGSKATIRTAWLKGNKDTIYNAIALHIENNGE
jgi:hypothetical protein